MNDEIDIDRLREWSSKLSYEQLQNLALQLIEQAVYSEDVSFNDTCLAPYWSNTGDPLIEGQKIYNDD